MWPEESALRAPGDPEKRVPERRLDLDWKCRIRVRRGTIAMGMEGVREKVFRLPHFSLGERRGWIW